MNKIDLNGREWIEKGKVISVYLNISAEGINNDQMDIYKHAISEMFNEMISSASNGFFEGNVYFFDNNPSIVQSLTLSSFCDPSIGGQTSYMSSFVNPYDENGILLPAEVVAQSSIHEMLHTLRLGHPFEITQSWDTQLIKIGPNEYKSALFTDPNIVNNIMNYSNISVDGKHGYNMRFLTSGQFEFLRREIYLQKHGYGYWRSASSDLEESLYRYHKYYESYWKNFPGLPVK